MRKESIKFTFVKRNGVFPICLAKTKFSNFICLEYLPEEADYLPHCNEFLSSWVHGLAIPNQWQETTDKSIMGRIFEIKVGRKKAYLPPLDNLPF